MLLQAFYLLDTWLIAPFRWTSSAMTGFFFGCLLLAVQSVFIGRLCTKAMIRLQGKHGLKHEREAAERSGLAIEALKANDKNAYLAQNTLAKDAYGHSAALSVGKVTASLWPAVAALAWLDLRFRNIPLELPFSIPGIGSSVLYPFYFIPIYFFTRFFWAYAARRFSHWRQTRRESGQ